MEKATAMNNACEAGPVGYREHGSIGQLQEGLRCRAGRRGGGGWRFFDDRLNRTEGSCCVCLSSLRFADRCYYAALLLLQVLMPMLLLLLLFLLRLVP